MTMALNYYQAHRTSRVGQWILNVASEWLQHMLWRHRLRRDRRRLRAMPDYLLKDIGITRWDIDWVTASSAGAARRRQLSP